MKTTGTCTTTRQDEPQQYYYDHVSVQVQSNHYFILFQSEETPRDDHLIIYRDAQTQTMRGWYRDDADTVPYQRKSKSRQKQTVFFTN